MYFRLEKLILPYMYVRDIDIHHLHDVVIMQAPYVLYMETYT